jgi:predicted protein tyrosine phosphatase
MGKSYLNRVKIHFEKELQDKENVVLHIPGDHEYGKANSWKFCTPASKISS